MRSRFLAAIAAAAVLSSAFPHPHHFGSALAQGRSGQADRGGNGDGPGRSAESQGRGAERSGGRGLGGAGSEAGSTPGDGAPSTGETGGGPGSGDGAPSASPGASGSRSAPGSPAPAAPGSATPQPREPLTTGALARAQARSADETGGDRALPRALRPRGRARAPVAARPAPLRWTPGTPRTVVTLCWNALVAAAGPYDPVWLDVASAGRMRQESGGALIAPLAARVIYGPRRGNVVRRSEVACRLDARGRVTALR